MKVVAFLQDILPALAQLAALTSTTIDDTVCEFIRLAITNEQVAQWLQALIDGGLSAEGCAGLGAPPEVHAALTARGINWNNLLTNVLPKVLKIVAMFAK